VTSFREAESACDEYLAEISRLKDLLAQATARADDATAKEAAFASEAVEMARQWGYGSCSAPDSAHASTDASGGNRPGNRSSRTHDSPLDAALDSEASSLPRRRPLLGQWIDAQHSASAPHFTGGNHDLGDRSSSSGSYRTSHERSRQGSNSSRSRNRKGRQSRPVEVKLGLSMPPSRGGRGVSPSRKHSTQQPTKTKEKLGGHKRSLPPFQSLALRPPTPQTYTQPDALSPSTQPFFGSGPNHDRDGSSDAFVEEGFPCERGEFDNEAANGENYSEEERNRRVMLGRDLAENHGGTSRNDGDKSGGGALLDWNSRDPRTAALRAVSGQQSGSQQGRGTNRDGHRGSSSEQRLQRIDGSSSSSSSSAGLAGSSIPSKKKGSVARLKAVLKQQLRTVAEEKRQEARWFEIQQEEKEATRWTQNHMESIHNQLSSPSSPSFSSPSNEARSSNYFSGATFNRLQRFSSNHPLNNSSYDRDSVNSDEEEDDGHDYEGSPVLGAPPKGSYWGGLEQEGEEEERGSSPAAMVRMLRERRESQQSSSTQRKKSSAEAPQDASEAAAESAAMASANIQASSLKDTFTFNVNKRDSIASTPATSSTLSALRPASLDASPTRLPSTKANRDEAAASTAVASASMTEALPPNSASEAHVSNDDVASKEKRKAERRAVIAAGKASRAKAVAALSSNGTVQFESVQHVQLFYKEESVASMSTSLGHTVNAQAVSPISQPKESVGTTAASATTGAHTSSIPEAPSNDGNSNSDDDESVEFYEEEEDEEGKEEANHVEEAMMEEYGGDEEFEEEFLDEEEDHEDDEEEELTALAVEELGQKIRTGDTPSPSPFVGAPISARSGRESVGLGGGGLESLKEGGEHDDGEGGDGNSNAVGGAAADLLEEDDFNQNDSLESISDDDSDGEEDEPIALPSALSEWLLERSKALGLLRTLQNRLEPWLLARHKASSGAEGSSRPISLADVGELSARDLDAVLGCESPEDRGPAHAKLAELVSEAKALVMGG